MTAESPPGPAADALAALFARVEQHAEKIRRLDATIRALRRLPADAAAADPADTRLVASDLTPAEIAVPWPTREPAPAADLLDAAAEVVADALVGLGPDGAVRAWSPAAARLFGWTAAEVVGRPPPFLPADKEDEHAGFVRTTRPVGPVETVRRRKDGGLIPVRASAAPVLGGGVVFAFRPLTAETAPDPSTGRLLTLGRALGGVVHDFNNLLAVVQAHAELLAEGATPPAAQREAVEAIAVAADLAAGLTRELLHLARPEPGTPPRVEANHLLGRLDRVLKGLAGGRVRVSVVPGLGVPAAAVGPAGFTQVVLNLAVNARDAMPDGGTLSVRTAAHVVGPDHPGVPAGEYVVLTVADSGSGMDAEARARLSDPSADPGAGLGLGIVRDVVSAAGGHIEVESAAGWGTQVRVYFPRA